VLRFGPAVTEETPPESPPPPRVSLVAEAGALARLVDRLRGGPAEPIALDTEADSFHHYFEKVCLIQIGHGDEAALVDPLAPIGLAPLLDLLAERRLILHGADYDLRLLRRGYGFRASHVFDTMIAAQLLGETELGLAALLGKRAGVALDKAHQRADWSERPLAPEMALYAAKDVLHLADLARSLEEDLVAKGRLAWHEEECARLAALEIAAKDVDPENDWRIKGTNALSGKERAFARVFFFARDARARETDRPPFRVLTNERLLEAAKRAAAGETRLPELLPGPRPLPPPLARALREALDAARALPQSDWPAPRRAEPYRADPALERAVEELKKTRDVRAKTLGLDPGVLASRALLTAAARARLEAGRGLDAAALAGVTGMSRWRAEILAGR
jgi:ribonuclease D